MGSGQLLMEEKLSGWRGVQLGARTPSSWRQGRGPRDSTGAGDGPRCAHRAFHGQPGPRRVEGCTVPEWGGHLSCFASCLEIVGGCGLQTWSSV